MVDEHVFSNSQSLAKEGLELVLAIFVANQSQRANAGAIQGYARRAAAPDQPGTKKLHNALLVPPPLPNLSSDQLPKDTHEVSGLSGSVWCTPSLVVWDLVRPKRFENRHAASVSRPFHPKPTPEDPRPGCQPTATFFPSYERVYGAIATYA